MQLSLLLPERPKSNDSSEQLWAVWHELWQHYFPQRVDLLEYTIKWSGRSQKRTLASCNIEHKRVIVARELNYEKYRHWLSPLLYHEMLHAYLGVRYSVQGQRQWHTPKFRQLEQAHPVMQEFDHWVKLGGWEKAVRSDRMKRFWQKKKSTLLAFGSKETTG